MNTPSPNSPVTLTPQRMTEGSSDLYERKVMSQLNCVRPTSSRGIERHSNTSYQAQSRHRPTSHLEEPLHVHLNTLIFAYYSEVQKADSINLSIIDQSILSMKVREVLSVIKSKSRLQPSNDHCIPCMTCHRRIQRYEALFHLVFGSVECRLCHWTASSCADFARVMYFESDGTKFDCPHNFIIRCYPSTEKFIGLDLVNFSKTMHIYHDYLELYLLATETLSDKHICRYGYAMLCNVYILTKYYLTKIEALLSQKWINQNHDNYSTNDTSSSTLYEGPPNTVSNLSYIRSSLSKNSNESASKPADIEIICLLDNKEQDELNTGNGKKDKWVDESLQNESISPTEKASSSSCGNTNNLNTMSDCRILQSTQKENDRYKSQTNNVSSLDYSNILFTASKPVEENTNKSTHKTTSLLSCSMDQSALNTNADKDVKETKKSSYKCTLLETNSCGVVLKISNRKTSNVNDNSESRMSGTENELPTRQNQTYFLSDNKKCPETTQKPAIMRNYSEITSIKAAQTKICTSKIKSSLTLNSNTDQEIAEIECPNDGNYLFLNEVVDVCPICYECLDAAQASFNVRNSLITCSCTHCKLKLYFILKCPKQPNLLQIVTN